MVSIRIIMRRCMEIDEVSHITIAEYPTKAIRSKSSMISKDILKMGLRVCCIGKMLQSSMAKS